MPYRNLECENERTHRKINVTDIKEDNPIFQGVKKQLKKDISIRMQFEGFTPEAIADAMEKYRPHIVVQKIYCSSCKYRRVDAGPNNQTKTREDLWRSYETDRFVRQIIGGNNDRR